ncbi:MAG: winged helix-turn-helix domain-containing protein [Gammaproteobacteria bacterium]|nr:winged helix-turn-helix domain-containing protein [Gammaproteobacteria bacterium]
MLPRKEKIITPDETHHVEPKVMDVLVCLATRAGEVVTRDELLREVWSDTIVGDEVLSRAISLLRSSLGDERTNPKFIRTIPRHGYELIADIVPVEAAQAATRNTWQKAIFAMVGGIALAGMFLFWQQADQERISIAVLPLTVTESAAALPTGGEGIAVHLISALTRSPDLNVIARRTSFQVRDDSLDIRDIGDQLDADYLVEGSLAQSGSTVMLTLGLVNSDLGTNVWTEQIEGSADDLAALRDDALEALSSAVQSHLGIRPLTQGSGIANLNEEAYRKYLEAKYQWSLRGELRINRAIELLREAITLEPEFAQAHLALAETVVLKPFYPGQQASATDESLLEQFNMARQSAEVALQLDPTLAVDVDVLEGSMLMHQQQWLDSELRFKFALQQDPENALGHYWYSMLLSQIGDYSSALDHILQATRIEPLSAVFNDRLALAYLWVGDNEAAGRQYQVAGQLGYLESTQPKPYILYALRSEQFDAIRSLLGRLGLASDWVEPFVSGLADPAVRADSVSVLETAIAEGRIPRIFWFGIWVLYEDADRAMRDFDPGFKTQDIELLWAAETDFLRKDPRFNDLLSRVNLDSRTVRFPQ